MPLGTETMKQQKNRSDTGFWRGGKSAGMVIAIALGSAAIAAPAHADNGFDEAHSLHSLDIMLMVTSLRCRLGPNDFQSDYHQFSAAHSTRLSAAGRTLRHSFAASYGEPDPARALDRMGVRIANSYGDGHPWLSCAELKQEVRELSQSLEAGHLARKARYLLSAERPPVGRGQGLQIAQARSQAEPARIAYNMTADWEKRP